MKILNISTLCLIIATKFVNAVSYESLGIDASQKQLAEEKMLEESTLPIINISTRNNSELILSRENYTEAVIDVINVEDNYKIKEGSARVKLRGNSSSFNGDPEKMKGNLLPYKISFDKKTNMLGLHNGEKFKNWVLLKPVWNIIANDIAFKIARIIFENTEIYITDSTFINLYINDEYQNIYHLCEQNQAHEKKVNIMIPEKNYTGTDIGYYFEINNYFDNEPQYFTLNYENATVTDINGETRQFYPAEYTMKSDIYSQEQFDFIGNYTQNVFKIIYLAVEKGEYKTFDENFKVVNSTFTNSQDTISALLDIDSVVNMYLLYETVHDNDCGEGSFYFAVDFSINSKIPKLQMTSPWDFDWGNNYLGENPDRYFAGVFNDMSFVESKGDRSNPWFILLIKEKWFQQLVSKKWVSVSERIHKELANEREFIESIPDFLKYTIEKNARRFFTTSDWLEERFQWLDKVFVPDEKEEIQFNDN
ncbi:hypothetical protein BCR32DRAFT_271578 [Anaeromyces robustus]|uniref:Coth-domain-containing protein n=1 Tax=Anaeromyces robustus TaxID=1754192 RepID=A0A1Y1WRU1_9FUNG|nr:hypothetical protein BCR32DRAFT_271578 [Anaeromyces robustus]|eukprot:ORX75976.1 hypothetical protein BCR32DRAFT_271578 [Anaeromyces robustus]